LKIKIQRFNKKTKIQEFKLGKSVVTLLEGFNEIKTKIDASFTFRSGCRSEVCGSCAVVVNGKEKLACGYKVQDGDIIEPLKKATVIKDMVVELDNSMQKNSKSLNFLDLKSDKIPTNKDEKRIEVQSNCILCNSCYSSCPILEVNKNFLGPFALSRNLRYVNDVRVENIKEKLGAVQSNGIWDCTLCGECTLVCPQNIDPKTDILMLRTKSIQQGFSDPTYLSFDDFSPSGFNPNF